MAGRVARIGGFGNLLGRSGGRKGGALPRTRQGPNLWTSDLPGGQSDGRYGSQPRRTPLWPIGRRLSSLARRGVVPAIGDGRGRLCGSGGFPRSRPRNNIAVPGPRASPRLKGRRIGCHDGSGRMGKRKDGRLRGIAPDLGQSSGTSRQAKTPGLVVQRPRIGRSLKTESASGCTRLSPWRRWPEADRCRRIAGRLSQISHRQALQVPGKAGQVLGMVDMLAG